MMKTLIPALRMVIVLSILTGVIYPLAITLAAQGLMPEQANGSLVKLDGRVVGSALLGQANSDPRYFWPRPSAVNYLAGSTMGAPAASGASNLGPTSAGLAAAIQQRSKDFQLIHSMADDAPVPVEMITASASGLDPHISPQAARLQAGRVAAARGVDEASVLQLVGQHTEAPQFGFLGEPRVNVLLLNWKLDEPKPLKK